MKKIAILLVLYNDSHHLVKLVSSISNQSFQNFDIYALETSESGESITLLKNLHPNVHSFPYQGNLGFAAGNNFLAKKAYEDGVDFLFVLNTDMELSPNTLEVFLLYFNNIENLGIINAVLLEGDSNKLQEFGIKVDFKKQLKVKLFSNELYSEVNLPDELEVDMVNGGSTFLSKKVYEELGLWEEKFFMYNDEIDLAYKMHFSQFKTMVTSKVWIRHHHNWNPENKSSYYLMYYYMMRNRILYFKFHRLLNNLLIDIFKKLILFPAIFHWLFKLAGFKLIKYYYLGILHGIIGVNGRSKINFYK
jgi:GT2 family glycosyltransferase